MNYHIVFDPAFEFRPWADGIDRVTAGGDNGFNARFQTLEADLTTLAARVADINTALNAGQESVRAGLATFRDGIVRHDPEGSALAQFGFSLVPIGPNDFMFFGGRALVGGHLASLEVKGETDEDQYRYSKQPWADPVRAAADGVPVIPPLTAPTADRFDLVYVDTWEREEVTGGAGRFVREVALFVAQGQQTLPTAPPGHDHLRLALLDRRAGSPNIKQVIDQRQPIRNGRARQNPTLPPLFLPESFDGWSPWQTKVRDLTLIATKPDGLRTTGVRPLPIPHGAHLVQVTVRGSIVSAASGPAQLHLSLVRVITASAEPVAITLSEETVTSLGSFVRGLEGPASPSLQKVDAATQYHYLYAWAEPQGAKIEIHHVQPMYDV